MARDGGLVVETKRVVVAGAGGVFGSLLVRALGDAYEVVATTRDTLDLRDLGAVRAAARGAYAVACAAGPFQLLDRQIVHAVAGEGAHWLDISDDGEWFFDLFDDRRLRALAEERGVAVMPGLSSLPAISGALVRRLGAVHHVDITLSIGNRNAKGAAAIASAAGLRTPDSELLWRELHIAANVHTKFEMPGVSLILRFLKQLPIAPRVRIARAIASVASKVPFGTSGGAVEVVSGIGATQLRGEDQRMAILPLVYALGHLPGPGVHSPSVLDQEDMLRWIEARL